MSFGGGTTQYILEYIVKVTNQGGSAGAAPLQQISTAQNQVTASTTKLSASQEKLRAAHERVTQAGLGVSKAAKGMTFGIIGITTAGAEAVGMLSMYRSTQEAVTVAQKNVDKALQEGGKNTKDYKDATQELVKAQRWQRMTQRNLMLSFFDLVPFVVLTINGMLKLKTALNIAKEAKAAEAAIKAMGVSLNGTAKATAAMNTAAAASGIQLSKYGKGAVIAQGATFKLSAETIKGTAAMRGIESGLIASSVAASKAAPAITNVSKAMRVLTIAAKVLIPLVAIELASQAFQNNWGGFRDRVNEVGKALGDAIPAAKGFLDIIDKVGRSIVAVFTGNFEDIQSIWASKPEGPGAIEQMSKADKKAADEWQKIVDDVKDTTLELINTIAMADKKERGGLFKSMGFKGNAKDELNKVFNGIEKVTKGVTGLSDSLRTMAQLNSLKEFGLKIDPKVFSKSLFTLEDRIKEASKKIFEKGSIGRDLLDGLSKAIRKDAKSKDPANAHAIADYLVDHPNILTILERLGLPKEVIDMFRVQMNDEIVKQKAAMDKLLASFFSDPHSKIQQHGVSPAEAGTLGPEAKAKALAEKKKPGSTGIFGGIISQIEQGVVDLKAAINKADWVGIGATLRESLNKIFTSGNIIAAANWFTNNILIPILQVAMGMGTAIAAAMKPEIDAFMANPLGTITGGAKVVTNAANDFMAGLLGFTSQADMNTGIDNFLSLLGIRIRVGLTNLLSGDSAVDKQLAAEGGTGGGSVGSTVITNWLKDFTNAGTWDQAVKTVFTPTFWSGVFQQIQNNFDSANPTITAQTAGDTRGAGQIFMENWLMDFTGTASWQQAIDRVFSVDFWNTIFQEIQTKFDTANAPTILPGTNKNGSVFQQVAIPWLTKAYADLIDWAKKDPTIQSIAAFIKNPVTSIINLIKNGIVTIQKAASTKPSQPTVIKGNLATEVWTNQILPIVKGIWNNIYTNAAADPTVKLIAGFFKDPLGSLKSLFPNIFQTAAADKGDGKGGPTSGIVPVSLVIDIVFGNKEIEKQIKSVETELNNLGSLANQNMTIIAQNSKDAATALAQEFSKGAKKTNKIFSALSTHWNQMAFNIAKAASSSANKIAANFSSGAKKVRTTMSGISTHWNNMCVNMVKAAKNAASQINSAIQGIQDKTVTVHVVKTGGVMSFAKGGIISAASGRLLTTSGPTYLIGDNPGGQESVWAVPHNNPGPTVNRINRMYGTGPNNGSMEFNGQVMLHISGNDIINDKRLNRRIRMTVGDSRDRFG